MATAARPACQNCTLSTLSTRRNRRLYFPLWLGNLTGTCGEELTAVCTENLNQKDGRDEP
jgi:hypothetical protein